MNPDGLAGLRDIHLPPPPDLSALLPAVAAVLLLLVCLSFVLIRRRRRRAQRRALRALARLAAAHARDGDEDRMVAGLSTLLRAYAIERYPGEAVAGLTGAAWLAFLDARGGDGGFSHGPGAALAWRPYRPGAEVDASALLALAERWIRNASAPVGGGGPQ